MITCCRWLSVLYMYVGLCHRLNNKSGLCSEISFQAAKIWMTGFSNMYADSKWMSNTATLFTLHNEDFA
jgi:hypothetical protein